MPQHRGAHWTTGLLSADLCVIKSHKQAHLFRELQEEAGGYRLKSSFCANLFPRLTLQLVVLSLFFEVAVARKTSEAFFDLSFDLVCQTFDFIFCARLHDVSSKQVDSPKWISRKARSPHFGFGPHTRQIGSRASTYFQANLMPGGSRAVVFNVL